MKRLDLTGRVFGNLTVTCLSHVGAEDGTKHTMWMCRCICGNAKVVRGSHMTSGLTKSCGCLFGRKGRLSPTWSGYEDIPGHRWCQFQHSAKKRGYEFSISIEHAWQLFLDQGGKCALSGVPISFGDESKRSQGMTASPDRKDSSLGYIPGNVQWLHKDVNRMKNVTDDTTFVAWCKLVARNHKEKISA